MTDHLATGALNELIESMPPRLKRQFDEDIARIDRKHIAARRPGDPKVIAMKNHLKWCRRHKPDLDLMKIRLFGILMRYLPINIEQMINNELPSLSECSHFWGLKIRQAERESNKTSISA